MVWKTLSKTYQMQKMKPIAQDLNPKAVTNDELFGVINPSTREWKDGLFSVIMRDLANITHDGPKWIVLDGDIDPMWIESLNTVMDDNKVKAVQVAVIVLASINFFMMSTSDTFLCSLLDMICLLMENTIQS